VPRKGVLDDTPRRRLLQGDPHVAGRPFEVAIDRLFEQGFLVAEGGVQAGPVDPMAFVRSGSEAPS